MSLVYCSLYCCACFLSYFLVACAHISPSSAHFVSCCHPGTSISAFIMCLCGVLLYANGIGWSKSFSFIVRSVLLKLFPIPSQYGNVLAPPLGSGFVRSS